MAKRQHLALHTQVPTSSRQDICLSVTKESSITLQYPMLMKTNFSAWSIMMKAFMEAHGIWDAILPVDLKEVVDKWKDKMARASIFQAIPALFLVAEKKTEKEV